MRNLFLKIFVAVFLLSCTTTIENSKAEEIFESEELVQVFNVHSSPVLGSYWSEYPSIRICEGSGITKTRISQITSFWIRMGYEFGGVFFDPGSEMCEIEGVTGQLTFMIARSDTPIGNNLALTRTWYNKNTGQITKAQVYVLGGFINKVYLLEHEMGHALGWDHFNRKYHIMNQYYDFIGSDSYGLNTRSYIRETDRIMNSR